MVALCIISGFFGFFILPCLPVGVALAVEVTYPVPEATPVGFMVMGGQVRLQFTNDQPNAQIVDGFIDRLVD